MAREIRDTWKKRVSAWKRSGLTRAQFCAKRGINPHTLSYWTCRLNREEGGGADAAPASGSSSALARGRSGRVTGAPAFVEVPISAMVAEPLRFELQLTRERILRIPEGFDASGLRTLLSVLEESP